MIGQLYRVTLKCPRLLYEEDQPDPAGDPVHSDDDDQMIRGFVMARDGDDIIICLFKPAELPENVGITVLKQVTNFHAELDRYIGHNETAQAKMARVIASATTVPNE
jgi:hypothetical protein